MGSQEVRKTLTEQEIDNLEWARDFMNNYEKKHKKPVRYF